MWQVVFTRQAQKDAKKLKLSNLDAKAKELIKILKVDPFQTPPPVEALRGNLKGAYSRRINIQHRIVYTVIPDIRTVKVISMWTHYDF